VAVCKLNIGFQYFFFVFGSVLVKLIPPDVDNKIKAVRSWPDSSGWGGGGRKFSVFSFCTAPRQTVVSTKPHVLWVTRTVHEGIIRLGRGAITCLDLMMALGCIEIFLPFPSLGTHLSAAMTCLGTSSTAFACLSYEGRNAYM